MPTQTALQPAIQLTTFRSAPAVTSTPGVQRVLTLPPALNHGSTTTRPRTPPGPHLNTPPQPQRWFRRAGWRIFGAICTILTLAFTIAMLVPTFWGTDYGRRSYELAKWEAAKDFIEACSNQKNSRNKSSEECEVALNTELPPPPYVEESYFHRLVGRLAGLGTRPALVDHLKEKVTEVDSSPDNKADDTFPGWILVFAICLLGLCAVATCRIFGSSIMLQGHRFKTALRSRYSTKLNSPNSHSLQLPQIYTLNSGSGTSNSEPPLSDRMIAAQDSPKPQARILEPFLSLPSVMEEGFSTAIAAKDPDLDVVGDITIPFVPVKAFPRRKSHVSKQPPDSSVTCSHCGVSEPILVGGEWDQKVRFYRHIRRSHGRTTLKCPNDWCSVTAETCDNLSKHIPQCRAISYPKSGGGNKSSVRVRRETSSINNTSRKESSNITSTSSGRRSQRPTVVYTARSGNMFPPRDKYTDGKKWR